MAVLTTEERQAIQALRNGGHLPQKVFAQLLKKKLVTDSPVELTVAGRIVCELLQEMDQATRGDDSDTRGEY
jgi:hypothetical protein